MKDIEKKIADCFRSCKKILTEEYDVMGLAISRLVYVHTHIVCIYSACMFTHSVMSNSLPLRGPQPTRLLCPWDFPDKHTGVVCHFLFQGIFLTQGSNLCLLHLLHCRWILYCWVTWEAHVHIVLFQKLLLTKHLLITSVC